MKLLFCDGYEKTKLLLSHFFFSFFFFFFFSFFWVKICLGQMGSNFTLKTNQYFGPTVIKEKTMGLNVELGRDRSNPSPTKFASIFGPY